MSDKGQLITSADGTKIWAQVAGNPSAPAVVFIHGFSCTALSFQKQFSDPNLLSKLQLIRYEVRGHGRSDQPLQARDYESIRHAEDFKAVVDTFNVVKPFVAGWSLGGIVAADVVAAYGSDFISGSILLGGMPYRSMHPQIAHSHILGLIPGLLSEDLAEFAVTARLFVESCVAESFEFPEEDQLMAIGGVALQHPLVRKFSLGRTQDEAPLLAVKDSFPFLVIHGTLDRHMYSEKVEQFMKQEFGNVEFHLVDGVGHMPFYEKPGFVNETILGFVERIRKGGQ